MTYPDEFQNFWSLRDDLCRARVTTRVWKRMLLEDLDRTFTKHGWRRRLVGKRVGPGVYEVTIEPEKERGK